MCVILLDTNTCVTSSVANSQLGTRLTCNQILFSTVEFVILISLCFFHTPFFIFKHPHRHTLTHTLMGMNPLVLTQQNWVVWCRCELWYCQLCECSGKKVCPCTRCINLVFLEKTDLNFSHSLESCFMEDSLSATWEIPRYILDEHWVTFSCLNFVQVELFSFI